MQRVPRVLNKKRLVRYKEGSQMYSMGMNKFQTLAKDAGATLKIDRLDIYTAGNATVNFVFDRYMSTKSELRATTRRNYTYMYDHFVRDGFGKKKNTFCTRMRESTTDIHTIQKIMGHANFQSTMDIYAEVTGERKHSVMKELASKLDVF